MYVLKKNSEIVKYKTSDVDNDKYEWKYNNDYDYVKNEEIKPYNNITNDINDSTLASSTSSSSSDSSENLKTAKTYSSNYSSS